MEIRRNGSLKKRKERDREREKVVLREGWPLIRGSAVLVVDILSCAFWRCLEMSGHFCVCAPWTSFFLLYHVVRLFPYLLHCSFVVNIFGLNVLNQGSVTLLQTNSAERKSLL